MNTPTSINPGNANNDIARLLSDLKSMDLEPALSIVYKEKLLRKLHFVPQYISDKCSFEIDNENQIARINLSGKVNKLTTSKLFLSASDAIEFYGATRLLIDLSSLLELDTESRIIIKDLLKLRTDKMSKRLESIVFLEAKSSKGKIFGDMISLVFTMQMPSVPLHKHSEMVDSIESLLG